MAPCLFPQTGYWLVIRKLAVTFVVQLLHGEKFQGLTEVLAGKVFAAGQAMHFEKFEIVLDIYF